MTPALSRPARVLGLFAACPGLLLLGVLLAPAHDPVTHGVAIEWRPSAELAGLLLLVAVTAVVCPGLAARRGTAIGLTLLVLIAALLNLAAATASTLLGRNLNLYWDLRHLPALVGLAREAAGLWRVSAGAVLVLGAVLLAGTGIYWIWRKILAALSERWIAVGAAVVFGLALSVTAFVPAERRLLATGLGADIVRQASGFAQGWRVSGVASGPLPAVLAAPAPPHSDLAGLKRRDVYLVYIESYGMTVFDTPAYRAALREPLQQLQSALREAGYKVVSNRLISPTFGGGSWFAHTTMSSGVRLDDPVLYSQLLASGRELLPGYFKDAGWRTVDIMPGTKTPSSEAERAWSFDREVYARELDYRGPSFGWFVIPDQFTLDRAAAIRAVLGSERPVFMQIVLVSSHIPFSPVPPYLADWKDSGTFSTVPAGAWDEIFRPPEWSDLASGYLKSLSYDFAVLGGWLTKYLPRDSLVILLGDHQPPAVIGGEFREWTVPIHVLSRDPDLVAPFLSMGYVDGFVPTQAPPHRAMEKFLPDFLAAFDRSG